MQIRGLLQNPRFAWASGLTVALTLLFLTSNLFVLGGDAFFNLSNSILSPAAALLASFLFYRASRNPKDRPARPAWLGMAWGFGLWGLADLVWAYYAVAYGETGPYPSIADLLWVVAYVPLYLALLSRLKTLKITPTRRQRWLIAGLNLTWAAPAAIFILVPILLDFDPARLLEGLLNLAYPLADLGLMVLASLILVLLREGRFALVWRLIFSGIFIMTVSDLFYSYATWNGLYYPDQRVNLMTILVDTSYVLAYICSALGVLVNRFVWVIDETFLLRLEPLPTSRYYAFLATNQAAQVITASDNFYLLVNGSPRMEFARRRLDEVLGIRLREMEDLLERIAGREVLCNEPFEIKTLDRQDRRVWVTAVAAFNPGREFSGANFALGADLAVAEELRLPENRELRGMLEYLLSLAGSLPEDEVQALRGYFLEVMRLLSALLYQFGGAQFRGALFAELERAIREKNLPVRVEGHAIQIPESQEGRSLAGALLPLLQTARRFAAGVIGEQVVDEELEALEQMLPAHVQRDLDKYRVRGFAALA
jgi:hypothetical protein